MVVYFSPRFGPWKDGDKEALRKLKRHFKYKNTSALKKEMAQAETEI